MFIATLILRCGIEVRILFTALRLFLYLASALSATQLTVSLPSVEFLNFRACRVNRIVHLHHIC